MGLWRRAVDGKITLRLKDPRDARLTQQRWGGFMLRATVPTVHARATDSNNWTRSVRGLLGWPSPKG